MKITCPACAAEYNVDPSRMPATGLNMRCPKCSQSFSVSADGETTSDDRVGGTTLDGGGQSLKDERFYVKRPTGKVFGPFDRNAVQMMLKSKKLGSDAEVSTDKQQWDSILSIPAFSQFIDDKELPSFDKIDDPRSTMMGGWQHLANAPKGAGADLPAPKGPGADLPAPKGPGADLPAPKGARADLPAPKGFGADLPAPKGTAGAGLPAPKRSGAPELPSPKRPGGPPELPALKSGGGNAGLPVPKPAADLPLPKSSSGLPVPKGSDLPTPRSDLPVPRADLPASKSSDLPIAASSSAVLPRPKASDSDLFGGSALAEESDLFGGGGADDDIFGDPFDTGDDDDLFGSPVGGKDDDLFGAPDKPAPADDDLFGAPAGPAADDDDLFGAPPVGSGRDDLFGAPSSAAADDADLFGAPSEADDDLFGGSAPAAKDDFLGGAAGFSFLDDNPKPDDDWGDDLFGASEPSAASEAGAQPSAPAGDWGDDLLDIEPRPRPKATSPVLDDHDPFRPASTGVRPAEPAPESAQVSRESAVDADKKRGRMTLIAVPVLVAALGGAAYLGITSFTAEETVTAPSQAAVQTGALDTDIAKSDRYSDYAALLDAQKGPASTEPGRQLFLQSMMLARYPNENLEAAAKANAAKLDDAKEGWDALGRGAFEAQAGNADAARAYLERLASQEGDLGYFANLAMGMGDTKAVEAEAARRAALTPEKTLVPRPMALPTGTNNVKEAAAATNAAAGTNGAGTNGAAIVAATNNEALLEPETEDTGRSADFGGLVERGHAALDAAAKLDPKAASPHYWKGRLARVAGQPEIARKELEKAVELAPNHVASLVELGEFEYETGNLNEAIELLEKVSGELSSLASNSEKARALHHAGLVHVARRQTDFALESFTKALSIDPSRSDTLRALAEEYERAHRYKEALNFFTTNKNLGKNDPEVMLGIVRSHIGLEQWPQAIATLEEGQRQFPEDAQFPYYLGQLYMKRYAFADARKPLERAVEIEPALLTAHATLALLAWRQDKDVQAAEAHIRTIVSYPDLLDAGVATQVAEYYHESGNREVAEQWYREAIRRDPNHWPARLALSKLLLEEGKQDQARDLLERARQEGVQDVRLSAYLADAYRQAGDFDRAIDEINKVIEAFPKNEEYVFIRGRIHYDRGNWDNAQEDFQRAYDLNPRFHDAYFYVGRTAFERSDYENALKIFRHVLDYKPDRGDYRFMMARTLESLKRDSQALDEYRRATAVDPAYGVENPMVYVYRGRLLSKLGYAKEGKEDIARALELAPSNPLALLAMAESDYREKAYESAIRNYKTALEREPENAEGQYRLGMSYLYTDRRQEAAQRLQLAIKYGYPDPEVYKRLGYLYRDLGSRSQAADAFTKFLELATKEGNVPAATKREVLDQIESLR